MGTGALLGLACLTLALLSHPCYGQEPVPVFNISRYGARGDGTTLATAAINKAVAACVAAGGGTVYVPSGTFVTGSFRLFSNVNLYLSPGAILLASDRTEDYLLQKDYGFTGYGAGNKLGLIFADHAENVSVTGTGTIDGRPDASLYMDSIQQEGAEDARYARQGKEYMNPAYDRGEAPVMWKGVYGDRPGVELLFSSCRKVTIRDITIRNAADWSMNLLACDDAKVMGISIRNNMSVPNSDGIDMYDSRNVMISDCDIRAGDDALAVISTSNLTVTNCTLSSRSSGIRIGYNAFNENNSGNLLFDNIRIYGSNRGIGIFQRQKGDLENMVFSNMIIDTRLYPGQWWGHGEPIHISALPGIGSKTVGAIRNVRFSNIIASGEEGVILYGSPESHLDHISFDRVQLRITRGPLTAAYGGNFDLRPTNDPAQSIFAHDIPALYAQYVDGLSLKNLEVRWDSGLPAFFTSAVDCRNFQHLTIEGFEGSAAPTGLSAAITLRDGKDARIRDARLSPGSSGEVLRREQVDGLDMAPPPDDGPAVSNGYGAQTGAPATQAPAAPGTPSPFVTTDGVAFRLEGKPYRYIGANYWYGPLIASGGAADNEGRKRVRRELDFLVSKGVTNLRVLAGAEGSGMLSGRERVGPPLQPREGVFDEKVFRGLDYLLSEMGKRHMKAVLYLSNNWEWSGGFLQYLNWHGLLSADTMRAKLSWDEQRDYVRQFYTCQGCKDGYDLQARTIITRVNSFTHRPYAGDPTIMAWELGNEPRPMRPAADDAYRAWVETAAAYIKSIDHHHLVTVGTEGLASTEDMPLFERIHAGRNVDYLTIHIWPKNFGFFQDTSIAKNWTNMMDRAATYIDEHIPVAKRLNKPMVIEEFGLPRDLQSFNPQSPTTLRDSFYTFIFTRCLSEPVLAGCNFWAFGGIARPIPGQVFWKKGDDWMGDPPGEEQGLNTVFDSDRTTWQRIAAWAERIRNTPQEHAP